jgi:hypothetical protein
MMNGNASTVSTLNLNSESPSVVRGDSTTGDLSQLTDDNEYHTIGDLSHLTNKSDEYFQTPEQGRLNNLVLEHRTSRYKVFVMDNNNNLISDVDDATYRMFAETPEEVNEFLRSLYQKYGYGPRVKYYVYDTFNVYVNQNYISPLQNLVNSITVVQDPQIDSLLEKSYIPGQIYQKQLHMDLDQLHDAMVTQISIQILSDYKQIHSDGYQYKVFLYNMNGRFLARVNCATMNQVIESIAQLFINNGPDMEYYYYDSFFEHNLQAPSTRIFQAKLSFIDKRRMLNPYPTNIDIFMPFYQDMINHYNRIQDESLNY